MNADYQILKHLTTKTSKSKLKNLTYESILADSETFSLSEDDSYIQTYPEFLKYFKNIDRIDRHHLFISSHFIYGWMPTIIQLNTKDIDSVLALLNDVKGGSILTIEEILICKTCVNNSLVGLSKLLHFINPNVYAIWDSRVFRYLTENKSSYGIDNPSLYLDYLNGINTISCNEDYNSLHNNIQGYFGYSIEPMRAIELVMFETDRKRFRIK